MKAPKRSQGPRAQKRRYPCPLAKEYHCKKTYARAAPARDHANSHLNIRFPCPVADEYDCTKDFSTKDNARVHVKDHTHPYHCPHNNCRSRFAIASESLQHAYSPNHPLRIVYRCTMPKCRVAESRKVLSFSGKFYHRRTHVKRGDLGPDEELPTEDFEGSTLPHSDLPLFRDILKHAAQS